MIANKDNAAQVYELTPEEKALLERSVAPTLRNLRTAATDMFLTIIIIREPDSTLSDLMRASNWRQTPNNDQ